MKPAKPASTTMNEQTFVPPTMRALYCLPNSTRDIAFTKTIFKNIDASTILAGLLVLDTDFPTPQPSAHQYLLKVQAATLSQGELQLTKDLNPTKVTPKIPFHCLCGTVISTPAEDHAQDNGPRFKIGDVVFGLVDYTRQGGAADYVLATEDEIALKPVNISATDAAALVSPALTSWQALSRYPGLQPTTFEENQIKRPLRLFVTNVCCEVGQIVVQLLRAESSSFFSVSPWVCASCTCVEEEFVRHHCDVDELLVIPQSPAQNEYDIATMFRDRHWDPVDIVLDCAGGEVFRRAHTPSVVRNGGVAMTCVDAWPEQDPVGTTEQGALGGENREPQSHFLAVNPDGAALRQIASLVEGNLVSFKAGTVIDLVNVTNFLRATAASVAKTQGDQIFVVRVN
ncbi:unnamed protein product [Penicillium salamii]|nr:unnamed protein product [Penicillium salamii]CAG8354682.1 unnamed protein product [Penicillium salamii]